MVVAMARGQGNRKILVKVYKLSIIRLSSGDLIYGLLAIVNNNILYT